MNLQFYERRVFTFVASLFTSLGSFSLFSLLSYNMSALNFSSFAIEIQYAGFIAGLASMHLGYSLVTYSQENFFDKVFPGVFWSVFTLALLFGGMFSYLYSENFGIVIWIVATSIWYIFINSIRAQSNGDANVLSILIKFLVLLGTAWISLYIYFFDFYTLYGFMSMILMIFILWRRGFSFWYFSPRRVLRIFKHTSSRFFDELIRLSFYLIPITYAENFLGDKVALKVVLVLMLVKVLESLMYSVMVHTHVLSTKRLNNAEFKYITQMILFLIFITICGAFAANYIIDPVVQLWLDNSDLLIAKYVSITILSIPAVLLINYLKSLFESLSKDSPFLLSNVSTAIIFLLVIVAIKPDLYGLVIIFTLTFWLRLLLILFKIRWLNREASLNNLY